MLSDSKRYILYGIAGVAAYLWLRRRSNRSQQASTDFDAFLKSPVPARNTNNASATSFAAFLHVQPEEPRSTDFASFLKDRSSCTQQGTQQTASKDAQSEHIPLQAIPISVIYGTEYGFAREIAEKLCQQLKEAGKFWPTLVNSAECPEGLADLARQQAAAFVFSTQGDGVPPSEARDFCDWLTAGKCGPLSQLHYSVCALGDSAYTHFCRCGKQIDAALAAAGAAAAVPRVDVDKEDWSKVDQWISDLISGLSAISDLRSFADLGGLPADLGGTAAAAAGSSKKYSKIKPYYARVVAVEGLCNITSSDDKNTVRLEVEISPEALTAGGLSYQPGDALGIWPTNPPECVSELLHQLGATGDELVATPAWHYTEDTAHTTAAAAAAAAAAVDAGSSSISLHHALSVCYDLKTPKAQQLLQLILVQLEQQLAAAAAVPYKVDPKQSSSGSSRVSIDVTADSSSCAAAAAVRDKCNGSISQHAAAAAAAAAVDHIQQLMSDSSKLDAYLSARHLVDILQDFETATITHQQLLGVLRPLQPRLYSISSSPLEHSPVNSGVQATIAVVRYQAQGKQRQGVCSTQVGERLETGDILPIFISKNPDFRLPEDPATPLIMVGPGTGLAPFRSFILQRLLQHNQEHQDAQGPAPAVGPMHLFFGCRRRDQDFLYGQQLQKWHDSGVITLHTAFSRESNRKVYVQQRLKEASDAVWELLEAGGHFYVCGDAGSMAGAVESALLDIIQQHQEQGTNDTARLYLEGLAAAGRYQRDVWFS